MEKIKSFYKNKRVFVTGVTGFKGSWLCSWLLKLGAKVYGTGFNPNQNKNLFYKLNLNNKINLKIFDIRDLKKLKKFIYSSKPSIIFHLAAQPIIYESYKDPHTTFENSFRTLETTLEYAKSKKTHVIFMSSSMVYGNFKAEKVDENTSNFNSSESIIKNSKKKRNEKIYINLKALDKI